MEIILSVKNKQARLALPHHACKFSSVQKLHEYPPRAMHMGWGVLNQQRAQGHTARMAEDSGEKMGSSLPEGPVLERRMARGMLDSHCCMCAHRIM